ncbi:uncharacterized protein LOC126908995 [Daktulosphaira vitifoliae]|uniref:uncharacterized protein LOC126908995 n=1 Tax=Daktulosphaira vitifoliae TaxID=58002 RepID=UPI0021A98E57|nr:uncharacterized protein LOC126908995 [Daktulosphaira vitifoliae]
MDKSSYRVVLKEIINVGTSVCRLFLCSNNVTINISQPIYEFPLIADKINYCKSLVDNLMEYYFRRHAYRDTTEAMCLAAKERHLAASNKTLTGYGLSEPDRALLVPDTPTDKATKTVTATDVAQLVGQLNEQQ